MHEYEFRLVVCSATSFLPFLSQLGFSTLPEKVYYIKPHFRWRRKQLETKRVESTQAVYHDGLWFRWVHSIETPLRCWSRATKIHYLHAAAHFQHSFRAELRHKVHLDSRAQLYTFQDSQSRRYRLVFEWELDSKSPTAPMDHLLQSLSAYRPIYNAMRPFAQSPPPYTLSEELVRKPVITLLDSLPEKKEGYLYAPKLDGTFGIVLSYPDRIKQKWEGYECVVQYNVTLGNGLVFAAERLDDSGQVFLLDVYQVQGHPTASGCRKAILTEFLPQLKLIPGYSVQTYVSDRNQLKTTPGHYPMKVDGIIAHDVEKDVIYKWKPILTLDLVHVDGYWLLPNGRIQCQKEKLENGAVYEISITDGRVLRKRPDRFKGNTMEQIKKVMKSEKFKLEIIPITERQSKKQKRDE